MDLNYTTKEYKKLTRKIDRYLLPMMWLYPLLESLAAGDSKLIKWLIRLFCYGTQQTDKSLASTQAVRRPTLTDSTIRGILTDGLLGFRDGNSLEIPRSRIPVVDDNVSGLCTIEPDIFADNTFSAFT